MKTKEHVVQEQEEAFLSKSEQRMFNLLESIDSDYITFILGFISSIVINDFYSIFGLNVQENALDFWFMLIECILLTVATIILLVFSIEFSKMQRELSIYKTIDGRQNYFQEKMIGARTKKFSRRAWVICIFSALTITLNLAKFFIINFCSM